MGNKFFVIAVVIIAAAMFTAPVFAAAPTVVNSDVWLVAARKVAQSYGTYTPTGGIVPDRVWSSEGGTVLNNMGTDATWDIMRSPTTAGTVRIGSMTTESNFVFDTVTKTGSVIMKVTITLTETDKVKNPYGVGNLKGTLTAQVTSINQYLASSFGQIPGNAIGSIVTTHGTGAFENAKLTADLDMRATPFPVGSGNYWYYEFIFFGTHRDYTDNQGILTYHNAGPKV